MAVVNPDDTNTYVMEANKTILLLSAAALFGGV